MVRKKPKKEIYYHVYHKNATASTGVVFKVNRFEGLECMFNWVDSEKIQHNCGLYVEKGELKTNEEDYIVTEISPLRARKQIESSRYNSFSIQNWNN